MNTVSAPNSEKCVFRRFGPRIVGQYVASQTEEITFKNRRLAVTIKSSALRNELSFAKTKIIKNINRLLGEEAVEDIRFF